MGRGRLDAVALDSGEVTAILRLKRPVAAAPGDRFVLRRPSPARTEAGGRLLDVSPPLGVARRRATAPRLAALAAAATPEAAAAARLELHGQSVVEGTVRLSADVATLLGDRASEVVLAHHETEPDQAGMPLAALRPALARELRRLVTIDPSMATRAVDDLVTRLVADRRLERARDGVRDPGHEARAIPLAVEEAMDRLEAALDVPAPPSLAEAARAAGCPPAGLRALEADGRIVRVDDDLAWAAGAWQRLTGTALELAGREPLTPAALRDATGTSRKYVMAILEELDRRAVLRRTPAGHVPGPRAFVATAGPLATGHGR